MIDFHAHIIPGIDDGSKSIEETVSLLREAENAGFEKVIFTSHYLNNKYEEDEENRKLLFDAINQIKERLEINLDLYLGSEIYIESNIVELLKENKASTINNSRYVLCEFSMIEENFYIRDIIYELLENGYKPIIAHPERYEYIQRNPEIVKSYIDMGVLFQSNYGSFIGWYGTRAKKTAKKLLENDTIHFLGSDVHKPNSLYLEIPKCIKEIRKIISEEKFYELSTSNAEKVLKNERIEI